MWLLVGRQLWRGAVAAADFVVVVVRCAVIVAGTEVIVVSALATVEAQ